MSETTSTDATAGMDRILQAGSGEILRDDSNDWTKVPYQVRFGSTFKTMLDALKYKAEVYGADVRGHSGAGNHMAGGGGEIDADQLGVPEYFGKPFFKDTRLGMNDSINCLWQFNRDDDIVHPMMRTAGAGLDIGEGRVYSSTIEMNQSIAWFTFGVPRFTDIASFYLKAANSDLAKVNNTGFTDNDAFGLGHLFGSAVGALLFWIPQAVIGSFVNFAMRFKSYGVDRFYQLRPTMHLYYKYVDVILASWLVNTGLYGNGKSAPMGDGDVQWGNNSWTADPASLPLALRKNASIWDIITRKCSLIFDDINRNADLDEIAANASESSSPTSSTHEDAIAASEYDNTGFDNSIFGGGSSSSSSGESYEWTYGGPKGDPNLNVIHETVDKLIHTKMDDYDGFDYENKEYKASASGTEEWSGVNWYALDATDIITRTAFGATQFVGFRIEKSTDASESFSNSTGPSAIAEQLNSQTRESVAKTYDFGQAGGTSNTGVDALDTVINGVKGIVGGVLDAFNIDNLATAIVGSTYIDIPEQYKSSDFNKSHSLSFQLRSPYGDIVSIYQSIIVPLAMILAGALPRAAGPNSYVQPFLCRVYSKGLFSIPMGIIDSISIKRGASEFGWTYGNLPTCVDVSISIKDLTPVMYMGMKSNFMPCLFGDATSFDEYLLTLAGVGLFERVSRVSHVRRQAQYFFHRFRNTYTNPLYWEHMVGDSAVVSLVNFFCADNYISNN